MPRTLETADSWFWPNVERGAPTACWEWRGRRDRCGYGRINWGGRRDGAHRISFQLSTDPIPDGLFVLHTCDNPPCCNPKHLFLGTSADNTQDMMAKGRHRRTHFKLSESQVQEVKRLYATKRYSQPQLARQFGVTQNAINRYVVGRGREHPQKLTQEMAVEIRVRRARGEGGSSLASEFGISQQTVCDIVKGRRWKAA